MIGKIVFYHQSYEEYWYQQRMHPAIVTAYDPTTKLCDLTVFFRNTAPHPRSNIPLYDQPGDISSAYYTLGPALAQLEGVKK